MPDRLIVFDLDGTLLDTLGDIVASMNRVLAARGLPGHTLADYRSFVGNGVGQLARRVLPMTETDPVSLAPIIVSEFLADYERHMMDLSAPYAGVPAMLDELATGGAALSIASNKPHDAVLAMTEHYLGAWDWLAVDGLRAGEPAKPDPILPLRHAELAGLKPGSCIFVGDSDIDIETGRRAGMCAIGVSWGFRGRAELEAAGADAVCDSPAELPGLLDRVQDA